jgi:hypothetical protein
MTMGPAGVATLIGGSGQPCSSLRLAPGGCRGEGGGGGEGEGAGRCYCSNGWGGCGRLGGASVQGCAPWLRALGGCGGGLG